MPLKMIAAAAGTASIRVFILKGEGLQSMVYSVDHRKLFFEC